MVMEGGEINYYTSEVLMKGWSSSNAVLIVKNLSSGKLFRNHVDLQHSTEKTVNRADVSTKTNPAVHRY